MLDHLLVVSFDQTEEVPADNTSSAIVTPVGLDIEVLKTVDVAAPEEGSTVTYTVTARNLSGQPATNVLVRDVVPAGVTYVGSSISGLLYWLVSIKQKRTLQTTQMMQ